MYRYSDQEKRFLQQRADQFDKQVRRYKSGLLDEENFKQLRLRNGLYEQRHAHMLRVAIPYGQLNSRQLKKLAQVARRYDRGYGHFTTRQNIQFNWPKLEDTPEILRELATVDMHAIQTSGSCIRNITSDHLAGVAADEYEDPRSWCELLRQWSTLHPEFNWLPRKFKFAVTGARQDRAAIQFHDIGIQIFKNKSGNIRFKILVGGGMGRTPVIAKVIHSNLSEHDLLGYLQAILRVYNQYGRRDHKYRSRIKILVNDLGIDTFREKVHAEWEAAKQTNPVLTKEQIASTKPYFDVCLSGERATPDNPNLIPVSNPAFVQAFVQWKKHNTETHKVKGYVIVHVSLKASGKAPGDITADQMERLGQIAMEHSEDEVRVTHEQNMVLPYVRQKDLYLVWHALNEINLATPNIGKLTDMIACPGLDFCSLANAGTLPLSREIGSIIRDFDQLYDIGEIKLKMSGCMNACGHHHAGHIGILGVDKKGEEWYQITLGGSAGNHARMGERLGPAIARADIPQAIERIIETYLEYRLPEEIFLDTVIRIGITPFKNHVYQNYQRTKNHREPVAA